MQVTVEYLRQWADRAMDHGNARLALAIQLAAAEWQEMPEDMITDMLCDYHKARERSRR